MARIRSISPKAPKDEDLAALSLFARLAEHYLGLIADAKGRLEDRPQWIKAELFPYDDMDMDAVLNELARERNVSKGPFILRYQADGKRYIEIQRFEKYQNVSKGERDAYKRSQENGTAIPPPSNGLQQDIPEHCLSTAQDLLETAGVPDHRVTGSPGIREIGNSDSADADIGSRHVRGEGDLVWFNPDDSLGWHDRIVNELQKQFPARTRELGRRGGDWLSELRGLSVWHATAPKSKRKRVSAHRWLFGRLFTRAERSALHAEKHRPARAAPVDESATWRTTERDEAEALAARKRTEACELDHSKPENRRAGRNYWSCRDDCGWVERMEAAAR